MARRTSLSNVYSMRPGHAYLRAATEELATVVGIPFLACGVAVVVLAAILLLCFALAVMLGTVLGGAWEGTACFAIALLFVALPLSMGVWHERRLSRLRLRIHAERLCLGCGRSLLESPTDDDGFGACPACGRAFHERAYDLAEASVRCMKCGYDLRGSQDAARCPECGTRKSTRDVVTAPRERST